ncbi:MAG: phage protein GemA/Gp16 family protein [Candidatus Accumulibacter sp. UW20]|jgi:phage gp16-like protein
MTTRAQYYAMIHLGAARMGHKTEADYREWLESLTGKRSCKECSEIELSSLVTTLRACNALENPSLKNVKGGIGQGNRPTSAQWNLANSLSRELGMSGCADVRFAAFAKRNANVDHPRFLTREEMRMLIAALIQWNKNVQARADKK